MADKTFEPLEYLQCKEKLRALGFTHTEMLQVINDLKLNLESFAERKTFADHDEARHHKVLEFIGFKRHYYESHASCSPAYTKTDVCNGVEYYVPKHYQGDIQGAFVYKLLANRFPWMDEFTKPITKKVKTEFDEHSRLQDVPSELRHKTVVELLEMDEETVLHEEKSLWALYEMSNRDPEQQLFFLHIDRTDDVDNSFYITMEHFLAQDYEAIKQYTIDYALDYYGQGDRKKYGDAMIKAAESSRNSLRLKEFMNNGKTK